MNNNMNNNNNNNNYNNFYNNNNNNDDNGRVFTRGFLGRLASDNWKSRENSSFSNSVKVKRVGKLQ